MKEIYRLKNGKELFLPTRMVSKKQLDEMGVAFLKGKIFLNKATGDTPFEAVPQEIKENMVVANYRDFSIEEFSEIRLRAYIKEQLLSEDVDITFLPYFKNEKINDVRRKMIIAQELKEREVKREIVLEIAQNSEIPTKELTDEQESYDFLSIFFGSHFGFYSNIENIREKIVGVKLNSNKKIFCNAVPYKFEAQNTKQTCFLPLFPLISDGYCKNWKRGGGGKVKIKIKVLDEQDLQSKDYGAWIKTYEDPNHLVERAGLTISELFNKKNNKARKDYEIDLIDSVIIDVEDLDAYTIESYVSKRFEGKYFLSIMACYNEKIIDFYLRKNDLFSLFEPTELRLIEVAIRNQGLPSRLMSAITRAEQLIRVEKNPSLADVIKIIG